MAEQFIGVDPTTQQVLWSVVVDQGYVPPLADMQAANPQVVVLRIPHTPALHDARQQHEWTVDPVTRRMQRRPPPGAGPAPPSGASEAAAVTLGRAEEGEGWIVAGLGWRPGSPHGPYR